MPGEESLILRYRLAHEFGLTLQAFRYSGASSTMSDVSERLESFVRDLQAPSMHFVGHSLGGLVIHRFLERFPDQPPELWCSSAHRAWPVAWRSEPAASPPSRTSWGPRSPRSSCSRTSGAGPSRGR